MWIPEPFCRHTSGVGEIAYLSLGSNVGDRVFNLRTAIGKLTLNCPLQAISSFYETQPVDVPHQSWFLNCVVAVKTDKTPRELLKFIMSIEADMGRVRTRPKGPRNIDLDILLMGGWVVDEPGLKIPHPEMHLRRFVLEPLAEIAPEAWHPVLKKTAPELLSALEPGQIVRKLEAPTGSRGMSEGTR